MEKINEKTANILPAQKETNSNIGAGRWGGWIDGSSSSATEEDYYFDEGGNGYCGIPL